MTSSAQPPALNTNPKELDIACPLCEYNLRGLSEPRCPECGYQFVWAELIDATQGVHPYLFEVQRGRSVWSFWKTLAGGLRPRRFWKTLKPAHRGNLRRLFLYWLIALLFGFAAAAALDRIMATTRQSQAFYYNAYASNGRPRIQAPSLDSVILEADFLSVRLDVEQVAFVYAGTILIWPLGTFLMLLIFQQSMARARIRIHHLLRCVIYSADIAIWASLFCIGAMLVYAVLAVTHWHAFSALEVYLYVCAAFVAIFCIRLWIAFRTYLQMDRPILTVLATQILVALTLFTALVVVQFTPSYRLRSWLRLFGL